MGKSIKTLWLAHHSVALSSRIREVRENLPWILERSARELEVLKRCLSMFIDRIFDSRVDGGIPSLAAAPVQQVVSIDAQGGPETRALVSAKAAPTLSRSSIETF